MNPGFLTSLPWAAVIDAALRSLLMAGAVAAGLAMLRVRNVVAQKAAWMLVLAASLAMPLVARWAAHSTWPPESDKAVVRIRHWTSSTPGNPARIRMSSSAWVTRQPDDQAQVDPSFYPGEPVRGSLSSSPGGDRFPAPAISHSSVETGAPVGIPAAQHAGSSAFHAGVVLAMLYLAICGALLARMAYGTWLAARVWRKGEPVSSCGSSGLLMRSSRRIASPVTVGSGILLPADYTEWDAEKLRIVLAHEASHVRQGDFYLQLAAGLYSALFWFSPLGWWLKRKLSDLSETISDRAAVSQAASHASYAQVLLEFAALPRPIPIGVAMAHQGRLVPRIERLLNESNFRQAFAGGRVRLAAAILLVPVALFAATALLRVQAAGQQPTPPPPANDIVPAPHPIKPPSSPNPPTGPGATVIPAGAPAVPPLPPLPPPPDAGPASAGKTLITSTAVSHVGEGAGPGQSGESTQTNTTTVDNGQVTHSSSGSGHGYAYSYNSNGDSYAVIRKNGPSTFSWFSGSQEEISKIRNLSKGDFLWFRRDGKSYIVEDPEIVGQILNMYQPMDALSNLQEALGKQQEVLGERQEELSKLQEQISVPTPDMTKQMAEVEAAMAALKAAKGQPLTEDKLADMQAKLANLQAELGALQGEVGARQGEMGAQQGKLGAEQGKLGAQQGKLGAEQGKLSRQIDLKVKSIIDECLKNGKAKPVE